jgi:ABC-type multidrug transport system permease subunit
MVIWLRKGLLILLVIVSLLMCKICLFKNQRAPNLHGLSQVTGESLSHGISMLKSFSFTGLIEIIAAAFIACAFYALVFGLCLLIYYFLCSLFDYFNS